MSHSKTTTLNRAAVRTIASHRHRCYLLLELESTETVSVDDLARRIADRDPEHSSDPVDRSTRRRLAIELVHDHLPRLDAHDVLEYDHESKEVTLTVESNEERALEDTLAGLVGR